MKKILCLILVFLFVLNVALISCGKNDETTVETTEAETNKSQTENIEDDTSSQSEQEPSMTESEAMITLLNTLKVKDVLSKDTLEAIFYTLPDSVSNYDLAALLNKLLTEPNHYTLTTMNTKDEELENEIHIRTGNDKIVITSRDYYETYNSTFDRYDYFYDETVIKIYFDAEEILRCLVSVSKDIAVTDVIMIEEGSEEEQPEQFEVFTTLLPTIVIHKSDITTIKETVIKLAEIATKAIVSTVQVRTELEPGNKASSLPLDTNTIKTFGKIIAFFNMDIPKFEETDIVIREDGFCEIQASYINKVIAFISEAFGGESEGLTAEKIGLKFAFKMKVEAQKAKLDALEVEFAPEGYFNNDIKDLTVKLTAENITDRINATAELRVSFKKDNDTENSFVTVNATPNKITFIFNILNDVTGAGSIERDTTIGSLTFNARFANAKDDEEYVQIAGSCTAEEISILLTGVLKIENDESEEMVANQLFASLHIFKDFANNETPMRFIATKQEILEVATEPQTIEFSVEHSGNLYTLDMPMFDKMIKLTIDD